MDKSCNSSLNDRILCHLIPSTNMFIKQMRSVSRLGNARFDMKMNWLWNVCIYHGACPTLSVVPLYGQMASALFRPQWLDSSVLKLSSSLFEERGGGHKSIPKNQNLCLWPYFYPKSLRKFFESGFWAWVGQVIWNDNIFCPTFTDLLPHRTV